MIYPTAYDYIKHQGYQKQCDALLDLVSPQVDKVPTGKKIQTPAYAPAMHSSAAARIMPDPIAAHFVPRLCGL
jgi:hypothetical protein